MYSSQPPESPGSTLFFSLVRQTKWRGNHPNTISCSAQKKNQKKKVHYLEGGVLKKSFWLLHSSKKPDTVGENCWEIIGALLMGVKIHSYPFNIQVSIWIISKQLGKEGVVDFMSQILEWWRGNHPQHYVTRQLDWDKNTTNKKQMYETKISQLECWPVGIANHTILIITSLIHWSIQVPARAPLLRSMLPSAAHLEFRVGCSRQNRGVLGWWNLHGNTWCANKKKINIFIPYLERYLDIVRKGEKKI